MVALKLDGVSQLCFPWVEKQERRGGIETVVSLHEFARRHLEAGTPWWH
mgnify:CR=1 FL=1